jgi:hypothetical protein
MNKDSDFVIRKGCCHRCGLKFRTNDAMSAQVEGKDYCKQCEKELNLGHVEIDDSREIISGMTSSQTLPYGELTSVLGHRGRRYSGV